MPNDCLHCSQAMEAFTPEFETLFRRLVNDGICFNTLKDRIQILTRLAHLNLNEIQTFADHFTDNVKPQSNNLVNIETMSLFYEFILKNQSP